MLHTIKKVPKPQSIVGVNKLFFFFLMRTKTISGTTFKECQTKSSCFEHKFKENSSAFIALV